LEQFASTHDVILFVAGEKSSNGRILFDRISSVNPRSYILNGPERLTAEMVTGARSIGVCGATSTPRWLMENVASHIKTFFE
jgi:4-hydroxy-3-methylbut-2-enyl diphosphate reductase